MSNGYGLQTGGGPVAPFVCNGSRPSSFDISAFGGFDIRHFGWLGTRKAGSEFILAGRTRFQTFHRSRHDGPQPPRRMRPSPSPALPPGTPWVWGRGGWGGLTITGGNAVR